MNRNTYIYILPWKWNEQDKQRTLLQRQKNGVLVAAEAANSNSAIEKQ